MVKTITLYTDAEFCERWPRYESESTILQKNFHRHGDLLAVLSGWELRPNFYMPSLSESDPPPRPMSTLERLQQQLADITGAIAHIEAHPEES